MTLLSAVLCLVIITIPQIAIAVTKANFIVEGGSSYKKVPTTFQWENANTQLSGLKCDDCSQQIDIGFDFPFAGKKYKKVYVSSNGLLSLLAANNAYGNTQLPTSDQSSSFSALILPYWDDLNPRNGGVIAYSILGEAPHRRLVVSWENVPAYSGSDKYSFQAILYETGEIKFQYGTGNTNGASATTGIEVDNSDYIQHSFNQGSIYPNSAILFQPSSKIPFQWETASTPISGLKCDDCAQQIDIGFDFPFAGVFYNKAYVSSNGLISFIAANQAYSNTDLPTSGQDKSTSALIMPYWDDLNPGNGGSITYATLGSAPNRRLVVSWENVPAYSGNQKYNFQAILYESGEIKFQYGSGNTNGVSATIGIEVANDDYVRRSYNQDSVKSNSALLFLPQAYVQSVKQVCGSMNLLQVRYSYPMDPNSIGNIQNYSFTSSSTQGLEVISANVSSDGYTVILTLNKNLDRGGSYQLQIRNVQSKAGYFINPNPTTRPVYGSSGLVGTYSSQYGIAQYFFAGPWVQRNDAQIDFDWQSTIPDILPRGDNFSIRWEGYLVPSVSGEHVFQTSSDDGVRLWVNGTQVIDATTGSGSRSKTSSPVRLNAGESVPIQLEYYELDQKATVKLFLDAPDGTSGNFTIIPSSALSPCPIVSSGPDHIRIEHDGNGITCMGEKITLRACADASCSTEYAGDVTLNLAATNGGSWSPNPVTFSGHTVVDLSKTTPGDTTLSIASATPTPVNDWVCLVNGNAVNQANCTLVFADAGFVFDVPNLTACETFANVELKAVKKDDNSRACAPAFSGIRTVKFWSTYLNPNSGTKAVSIEGAQVANSTPGTPITLNFTDGVANFKVNYPDVGKMQLDVRYDGSSATNDEGLVMLGSDQFVVRPHHFEISSIQCSDGTPNPEAADANGGKFCKAGQDFKVEVKAVCANRSITPNFGNESPAESVKLSHNLIAPSNGNNGKLTGDMNAFGKNCSDEIDGGVACGTFQWDEVGIITLNPSIADGDYLGAGNVTDASSRNVGRFYPHHFKLNSSASIITPACDDGDFSYMNQPFTVKYEVQANNASGGKTENYTVDFAKAMIIPEAENNGIKKSDRLRVNDGVWVKGVYNVDDSQATFSRDTSVDGPYDNLKVGISLSDPDGSPLSDLDMLGNTARQIGETRIRFGRLVLDSVYGSEFVDLSMPARAEYYDGKGWRMNSNDSCTIVNISNLTAEDLDTNDNLRPNDVAINGGGTLSQGNSHFILGAPGAGHTGSLRYRLTVPSWLSFDWDNDGSFGENPYALATFGVYQGIPSVIYQREVWAH